MKMDMLDNLSGHGAVIDCYVEPLHAHGFHDRGRDFFQCYCQARQDLVRCRRQIRIMRFGYDQRMAGVHRADVQKSQKHTIFVYFMRWYFSFDNLAKDTFLHIISNYQFTIFNEFSKGEIFKRLSHWNIDWKLKIKN